MKILVIEDSKKLRKSLNAGLSELGYTVELAEDGQKGLELALCFNFDIVLLDLMLPVISGLDVLRQIRNSNRQPEILILSARDQTRDRITCLELGADDYLVKPFSFDELQARIEALLKRKYQSRTPLSETYHLSD